MVMLSLFAGKKVSCFERLKFLPSGPAVLEPPGWQFHPDIFHTVASVAHFLTPMMSFLLPEPSVSPVTTEFSLGLYHYSSVIQNMQMRNI